MMCWRQVNTIYILQALLVVIATDIVEQISLHLSGYLLSPGKSQLSKNYLLYRPNVDLRLARYFVFNSLIYQTGTSILMSKTVKDQVLNVSPISSVDSKILARDLLADTNIEVEPDGTVSWTAPALFKSSCNINIGKYHGSCSWPRSTANIS